MTRIIRVRVREYKISKPLESAPRGSPSDPEISMESNGHVSAFRCRYSTLMSIDPFGYFLSTSYGISEVAEAYQYWN